MISRRRFLKISLGTAATTAISGLTAFAYAHDIEPGWVEVKPVTLTLPRLDPAFDGYRLVQISDIHMGTGMTAERLASIVELVNAQAPDVVVITGDFVTHGDINFQMPALRDGLSQLRAVDTAVAILGNHDHWTDHILVRRMLAEAQVLDISNGLQTIRRGQSSLHIAGVDDYWERQDRLDDVLALLPDEGCAILLAHEPDYADISAPTGRFDLQLSGHSHGGQVILPFIGPPILPSYSHKYPVGQYQVGSMIQYTNRGLGTVAPMVRFNCRPEITVFSLRHKG
ncbi:MAG TPA: metallophosphoesterase [Aggregatilineales bacterium]|nr:metallophosphoesterase [Aggregatilineales bacterium]